MRIDGFGQQFSGVQSEGKTIENMREGEVVRAQVVDVSGDMARIRLPGGTEVNARIEANVLLNKGDEVRLQLSHKGDPPTMQLVDNRPGQSPAEAIGVKPTEQNMQLIHYLSENGALSREVFEVASRLMQDVKGLDAQTAVFMALNGLGADQASAVMQLLSRDASLAADIAKLLSALGVDMQDMAQLEQSAGSSTPGSLTQGTLPQGATPLPGEALPQAVPGQGPLAQGSVAEGSVTEGAKPPQTFPQQVVQQAQDVVAQTGTQVDNLLAQLGAESPAQGTMSQGASPQGTVPQGTMTPQTLPGELPLAESPSTLGTMPQTPEAVAQQVTQQLAQSLEANPQGPAIRLHMGEVASFVDRAVQQPPQDRPAMVQEFVRTLPLSEEGRAALAQALGESLRGAPHAAAKPRLDISKLIAHIEGEAAKDGERVKRVGDELLRTLSELRKNLPEDERGRSIARQLDNVVARLQTSQDISRFAFVQLPVRFEDRTQDAKMYVMRRGGKKRIDPEDATLLIALDTEHMGTVESLIRVTGKDVNLQVRVEKDDMLSVFKSHTVELFNLLREAGYKLSDATFKLVETPVTPANVESVIEREYTGGHTFDLTI